MSAPESTPDESRRDRDGALRELALLFLKLGATSFGGPAAHIAMMEEEVVRRRRWLRHEELLDRMGATNLIPGPNSTELAMHIGRDRAGTLGMIVAGVSFIVPAALATGIVAWAYVRYGKLPSAGPVLYGIKPVILAVVAQAIVGLAPKAARTWPLRLLAVLAAGAAFAGVHEIAVVFGAGILAAIALGGRTPPRAALFAVEPTTSAIFVLFLKVGSVLFGSGYVLLAFLRADLVDRRHWLTEPQLFDAIAAGQITPGPVFSAATFIGYVLGGASGAAAATLGIFLPSFALVGISAPLVPRLRRSPTAGAFLDGVNAASLALMAVVALQMATTAVRDVPSAFLAAIAAIALVRFRVSSVLLVLGGALVGSVMAALRG